MNILYVNACVRQNSRTNLLAKYLLDKFNQPIDEIILNDETIYSLTQSTLKTRDDLIHKQEFNNPVFKYAIQFANADIIVVAAPFWDLSFPAILKTYFENINVAGITFFYTETGMPQSLCKAKKLIYVTTSGGKIFSDEYGFGYIKALCKAFYGIDDVICIKAEELDIVDADVNAILKNAKVKMDKIILG